MKNIVGVTIDSSDKMEYYYTDLLSLEEGDNVVVKIDNIERFGKVVSKVHPIDETKLKKELGYIVKKAGKKDLNNHENNLKQASFALKKCRQLVKKYNLDMDVIDATYSFNQEQLQFTFYAEDRIDFRDLAKELASIYKTRIELHQIGVRDKAKKVGGIGLCGQKLCCSRFIDNFDSVSISMAKNQNLSLNPTKINGVCGRLLCCLKYENDCYKECRKDLPNIGDVVDTPSGRGKVVSLDVLKKKYQVEIKEKGIIDIDGNN